QLCLADVSEAQARSKSLLGGPGRRPLSPMRRPRTTGPDRPPHGQRRGHPVTDTREPARGRGPGGSKHTTLAGRDLSPYRHLHVYGVEMVDVAQPAPSDLARFIGVPFDDPDE